MRQWLFFGEGDRVFGDISPVNLLEKFNEALTLFRGPVARGMNHV